MYEPTDLAIAPNGEELYLSDHGNHCVRKIDLSSGTIKSVAGQCGNSGFRGDGALATRALLAHPRGLAFTEAGELLIADFGNSVMRKVDMETGTIMTIAGIGGYVGYTGDDGSSTSAQLNRPTGIAVSENGDYYVADFGNHLVRVVEPNHTCYGVSNKHHSTTCSGNGYCVATDTCQCQSGYSGEDCSISNCYGTWSDAPSVCSGHGACTARDRCECSDGYSGEDCSLNICYGVESNDDVVCSGNGDCVAPNACECDTGYNGDDCSIVTCFRKWSNESSVCSGHGQCVAPNTCTCHPGYTNDICSEVKCPEDSCLNITESPPGDHQPCEVPTFHAQFPPVDVINITWTLKQFGNDIETITWYYPSSTFNYAPQVDNMYDSSYTVSVIMYYNTSFGEVRSRQASTERIAKDCKVIGSIQVSPPNGTLLITKFNLTTSGWRPTELVQALEYRFGVMDTSSNHEIIFLNSFSASTTVIAPLPIEGNHVTVVVECRFPSGHVEQRNSSVVTVHQPTGQDMSNYITKHNETLLTANNAEFETNRIHNRLLCHAFNCENTRFPAKFHIDHKPCRYHGCSKR